MKTQLHLSLDVEIVRRIKDQHINISALVEQLLQKAIINDAFLARIKKLENQIIELRLKNQKGGIQIRY